MALTPPKIDPSDAALLVMDVEHATLQTEEGAEAQLAQVRHALAVARRHDCLVGYVRMALEDADLDALPETNKLADHVAQAGTALHADSTTSAIPDPVAPQDEDLVVRKTRVGAFSTTDLHEQLQKQGIRSLLLMGISTSGVVLSTVRDAADRDYKVFVLSDACADPVPEIHDFLNQRIFPSQAQVITVAEFEAGLTARTSEAPRLGRK